MEVTPTDDFFGCGGYSLLPLSPQHCSRTALDEVARKTGEDVTDASASQESGEIPQVISELVLQRAASRIAIESEDASETEYTFNTRLTDLAFDSLMIAELIVELEQELGTLLDFTAPGQMETLGDLCRALKPAQTTQ